MIHVWTAAMFLIDGIGIIPSRQYIPHLFLFLLLCIFLYSLPRKKTIFFPIKLTFIFFCFLFFSFLSVFYSVDRQVSFETVLFYGISYLFFVYFYNNKDFGKKIVKTIIYLGSIIFTGVFLYYSFFNKTPVDGYQLVSSLLKNSHNHLGDFLGLILVLTAYHFINNIKSRWLWFSLLLIPFYLISFSRSSYLALIIILFLLLVKNKAIKLLSLKTGLIMGAILLVLVFFFTSVNEAKDNPATGKINRFLTNTISLKSKDFFAGRLDYLQQGIVSLKDNFFFGVGPGNFGYLSKKYSVSGSQWYDFKSTETAHSLIPEILFENGVFAFVFFTLFLFKFVISAFKKNELESYLLLYLLINFQTDYTYKIYAMFILMMLLGSIVYEENDEPIKKSIIFPIVMAVFLLNAQAILLSDLFLKLGRPELSAKIYPFNHEAVKTLIIKKLDFGCQEAESDAVKLYRNSLGELSTLQFLSSYYEYCFDLKTAIRLLDEAYLNNKFLNLDVIKKDYLLRKKAYGVESASKFLNLVLKKFGDLKNEEYFANQIHDFCIENGELACQEANFGSFKYFYEPKQGIMGKVLKQIPYPEEYTINQDTLNERYDYSVTKPKDTFRIVVLGGSETFGLLVKTKDNWTEKLEDMLNQKLNSNGKHKKIEVINLAVYGYDIPYSVERFRRRGLKYQPDLVLWFINDDNFYQFNEIIYKKETKIKSEMMESGELNKEIAKENYFSAYKKAFYETIKDMGETKLNYIIESYLKLFKIYYHSEFIIINSSLSLKNQKLITNSFGINKTILYKSNIQSNSLYQFTKFGDIINKMGQEKTAREIYRQILRKVL